MFTMKSTYQHVAAALAFAGAAVALPAHAAEEAATFTGHIDVVSKYVLRGVSTTYGPSAPGVGNAFADAPESNNPVLQWGVDWVHPSGVYLGYWGSQVNYSYKRLGQSFTDRTIMDFQSDKSIENDFYGGYNGKLGDFGYTVGATAYVYFNGKHANAIETKLGASYGDFSLNAQTLLNDVVWGNSGDTYWTLNYNKTLPFKLNLMASLGYYTYAKEGKFLGTFDPQSGACPTGTSFAVNGCFAGGAPSSGGFRHLIIGITQPIAETGLTWGVQGIVGGDNRFGVKQKNRVLASLSYGF